MRIPTKLLLFLIGLICLLCHSMGEEEEEEAVIEENGTLVPTVDGSGSSEGDEDAGDDDEAFDVQDLLPGFEKSDSDNFVKNYIMGKPEYYQETYHPPGVVPTFNSLPRFTHSSDFSLLMGDSPDQYFLGLLFIGCFIFTAFVFWGICLCCFKGLGPRHVGFLAGFPFREEGKKSLAGRITLSLSAWMMIIATIVLITKGLTDMQTLSDSIGITTDDIQRVEVEVQSIVTTLLVVSAKTVPIRDELVDFLKRDICPLEPGSDTEDQVRSVGEDTYDAMSDLDDFIEGYLEDVEDGVNQTNKFTNRVRGFVDQAQFVDNWKVTVVVFPYFIIPSCILVAVCMGWFDVFSEGFYTLITRIVLPLLIFMTILAIFVAAWMFITIQANSDLCQPAPEQTILNILNKLDLEEDSGSESKDLNGPSDSFFYDIMVFYTHQCTTANPWEFLEGHYADLARGRNILGEFIRSIQDTTLAQLSQECGQEYGPILELLIQLQDQITILSRTSIRALKLMSCRNIVPIYIAAILDATCTQAPKAQTWVWSCSLVIAFFGMMCITFRGAYYPIDYYYYDETGMGGKDDLYPTDDDSNDNLEDTECNELVLKTQREECEVMMEIVDKDGQAAVYLDDEPKEYEDDEDEIHPGVDGEFYADTFEDDDPDGSVVYSARYSSDADDFYVDGDISYNDQSEKAS